MDKEREQIVRKSVGRVIRAFRKSKNWSKTKLGDVCGVKYSSVAHWERGAHLPPAGFMVELAEILVDGTPNDLYGIAANTITRTDLMNAKFDLLEVLEHNERVTFDNIPLPEDMRKNVIKAITLALEMAGVNKTI
jgi:transcriptional regulator with XRE-family HTH domain